MKPKWLTLIDTLCNVSMFQREPSFLNMEIFEAPKKHRLS